MSTITINGKRYHAPSGNVAVINNRVFIDGKDVTGDALSGIVEIKWEGPLASLQSDAAVTCGDVGGNVRAGGSVSCDEVKGNVAAGGSVNCGDVGGNATAGGSINARRVSR